MGDSLLAYSVSLSTAATFMVVVLLLSFSSASACRRRQAAAIERFRRLFLLERGECRENGGKMLA